MPPTATTIDNAIARLQDLVQACTTLTIKSAPDYPIENADPFPFSAAYLSAGSFEFTNASTTKMFPVLTLEIHFSRVNIKDTYQNINAIALELPRRLAKDPTLNGTVSSIVATASDRITWEVAPFEYGSIKSQVLKFEIPFKTLQAPTS
jgi:hypothetical protein